MRVCVCVCVCVCVHLCDVAFQCWEVLGPESQEVWTSLLLYIQIWLHETKTEAWRLNRENPAWTGEAACTKPARRRQTLGAAACPLPEAGGPTVTLSSKFNFFTANTNLFMNARFPFLLVFHKYFLRTSYAPDTMLAAGDHLIHCWWGCSMVQLLRKGSGRPKFDYNRMKNYCSPKNSTETKTNH